MSSFEMELAARWWPCSMIILPSRVPDLSSCSVLVSEMVRTAILMGVKGRVSSMPGMLISFLFGRYVPGGTLCTD